MNFVDICLLNTFISSGRARYSEIDAVLGQCLMKQFRKYDWYYREM